MKKMFLAAMLPLVLSVFTVQALAVGSEDVGSVIDASICPKDTDLIQVCRSTPQKDDAEVAAGMLDALTICQKGQSAIMAVMKDGQVKKGKVDQVITRTGGSSYILNLNDSVKLEVNIPMGIRSKRTKATLSVDMKTVNLNVKSTYSCERQ